MGVSAAVSLVTAPSAHARIDDTPDCDSVAVVRCGFNDVNEMRREAAQGDVPKIYKALGISQQDLRGTFVNGIVYRDGRVTVDGKVVATGAMTAGRNYGGTPIAGTNAGKYPTSKFVDEGQTAFVKMTGGEFDFAVIKACGNPVSATPKQQPKPAFRCVRLDVERISRTERKFTAIADVSGGATVEKYEFGFGDGYGITVTEESYTYTYKKAGTFDTSVVLHVKVGDQIKKVSTRTCEKPVTITPKDQPVCRYDESLPKDSPDCVKPAVLSSVAPTPPAPTPTRATPTPTPTQPQKIADTGPAAAISGVVGSSALGYGAYLFTTSRRQLIDRLLGRH
ncbi:MAG TPA: PKD domain-containing protein [Candidatus Saccharimonadales bacterium]